jgi:two-component system, NarL family, nitrate/nitrite response regulator NarL
MMPNRNVLLVGTNWLLRQGFRPLLKKLQLVVSGEGNDFAEAYHKFSETGQPEMVMFLVSSTEEISGILTQLCRIRDELAESKLILVAERPSTQDVIAALRAGADGVLSSNISSKFLLNSLQLIMLGPRLFLAWPPPLLVTQRKVNPERTPVVADEPPLMPSLHLIQTKPHPRLQCRVLKSLAPRPIHRETPVTTDKCGPPGLSDREWQVLRCLGLGQSNKLIARELRVAETTVKVHIKSLLRKVGVANRTQAAIWGLTHDQACVSEALSSRRAEGGV